MKKITFTLLLYHLITLSLFSQEIKKGEVYSYARKIVDTMASQSMHGRGYVNGGDSIAANYLKNEFRKIGLKSFGSDYYQRMSFAINTFPDERPTKNGFWIIPSGINSTSQYSFIGIPGKNFLFESSSPTLFSELIVSIIDSNDVSSDKKLKKILKKIRKSDWPQEIQFLVIDDRGVFDKKKIERFKTLKRNEFGFIGIATFVPKLTWSQSQIVSKYTRIQIVADSFKLKKGNFQGDIQLQTKFIPSHPSQNVIGYIKGSVYPDSFIVYSAHYDHLGHMGKEIYFPGANDNASGCAMLLNLANYYSKPENKPKYSIAFMAFCGEEVGLLGSKYYTENPLFPLKNIKFVFNMDIMGTGEEGITVVNGTIFKTEFDKLKEINTQNNFIKDVKIRGKSANSDHYFFSEKGVKAFFIYSMGGIKAYHDIYD
ncbi:MAG TPA: M28 family peptidase, partial [Bacteroidia bacterium]|nr:M28 family peptidase [Bacteroidia bacterium]